MHGKVEHLFAQKTRRQEDIRQNKLPLPPFLSSPSNSLQCKF